MKDPYMITRRSCYLGVMIQSLVLNVTPLIFVTLREQFTVSLEEIGRLVLITFLVQLCVDFSAAFFVSKINPKSCMILAEFSAASGLVLFGILPNILADAYAGMVIACIIYSIGAGLSEVMISPIIDAIPSKEKNTTMSLLHSFYPIGQVLVVLLTTLSIAIFGEKYWPIYFLLWSIVPFFNVILVSKMPYPPMMKKTERDRGWVLMKNPYFWVMILLMICAGASEMAMSQWASLFAEEALGVSKLAGDLLGPCLFAVCMGIGRVLHGIKGEKAPISFLLILSGLLTVLCYALTVFVSLPILSLIGCALCGLSVSLMWPGVLSMSSLRFSNGGTTMFAFLALGGDIGCSLGPWITGLVADTSQSGLKGGLLSAVCFPIIMVLLLMFTQQKKKVED